MALDTEMDAAEAWNLARRNGKAIKLMIPDMVSAINNGSVTLEYVVYTIYQRVRNSLNQLALLKQISGMDIYVQTLKPTYVATAQIQLVIDAEQAVLDWIDSNASGLTLTGDSATNAIANGSLLTNRFTSAQLSGLKARLQAIDSAIG